MKILHVSPCFMPARGFGGSMESLYRLCLNLARLGCEVRVLTTNADGPRRVLAVQTGREIAVAAGFEVIYNGRLACRSVSAGLLMRLPFEVRRADAVHLTGVYSFPTIPTLLACKLMRKPLVWSPRGALERWHGSRGKALKRIWDIACRVAAPRTTMLHLTSEAERAESMRRFPRFSTTVVPNAVRVPAAVKHPAGDETLRLGYLGRLDPKKGIENLLEACRMLKDQGLPCSLVIAGAGPPRYSRTLARKIETLGLDGLARMVGQTQGGAKREFFQSIDLLVMPSYAESFATVVAEALAYAVPVIASRGTPWASLTEKACGLWVDNTPESLAVAIAQMRAMPLAEMGRRGREWMAAEYSWDAAARDVCNVYSTMLHGKPSVSDTASARGSIAAAGETAAGHGRVVTHN